MAFRVRVTLRGKARASTYPQPRRTPILPGAEDQRLALGETRAQHAADENQVVAAVHRGIDTALQPGQAPLDQRAAALARRMRHACELVGARRREMPRQLALPSRQHVDGEQARALEGRQRRRVAAQAPQHQRRIERHGRERVGGQSLELALRRARGDHGHPRRKAPERLAQAGRVHGIPLEGAGLQRHRPRHLKKKAARPRCPQGNCIRRLRYSAK